MGKTGNLPACEKETIINFNEAEAIACVFTYNKAWQRHLEQRIGVKPTMDNGYGGRTYEVDKRLIKPPRLKRQLSEKAKMELAKRAEGMRQKAGLR